jgi:hypothetical protein
MLIDRLNTLCSLVAEAHDRPFIAVGTPGGYWTDAGGGMTPVVTPPPIYAELSAALTRRLGWSRGLLYSAWIRSNALNVCFMGRSLLSRRRAARPRGLRRHVRPRGAGAGAGVPWYPTR